MSSTSSFCCRFKLRLFKLGKVCKEAMTEEKTKKGLLLMLMVWRFVRTDKFGGKALMLLSAKLSNSRFGNLARTGSRVSISSSSLLCHFCAILFIKENFLGVRIACEQGLKIFHGNLNLIYASIRAKSLYVLCECFYA